MACILRLIVVFDRDYRLLFSSGRTLHTILSPFRYIHMSERLRWSVFVFIAAHILISLQVSLDSSLFKTELRADPLSRCAALSLPKDAFAILPFFQTQAELDVMEQEQNHTRSAFF